MNLHKGKYIGYLDDVQREIQMLKKRPETVQIEVIS